MPIGAWRPCWHLVPTVASSPVLSTLQAGQEPGPAAQRWHPTLLALCPAGAGTGTRLALLWDCVGWRGGHKGSVCRCPDAPGEGQSSWAELWPMAGGVSQRHQLIVPQSQPLSAAWSRLKASELFDCGDLCQFPSLHPAESKVPATGTPACRAGTPRLPWEHMGTLCPPLMPTLPSLRPEQSAAIMALIT